MVRGAAGGVFWSPDRRDVGSSREKLKRVDRSGGPTLTLCDAPGAEAPVNKIAVFRDTSASVSVSISKGSGMSPGVAALLCWFLFAPLFCEAVELKPKTVEAWDAYVRKATAAMKARLESGGPFLASDQVSERSTRVRNGEIVAWPQSSTGRIEVPGGLIHHWTAAALIPGATQESVLAVVQRYGQYKTYYQPTVTAS